jgi:NAD-dependent dihydropyrimidine dehydrogenase PreA subunit
MGEHLTIVFSRDRAEHSAQERIGRDLLAGLAGRGGLKAIIVPHLYDLAPDGPAMRALQSVQGDMIVLAWLYPRAAYWILDANRIKGRMGSTSFFPEEELASLPTRGRDRGEEVVERNIWCIDLRDHAEAAPLLCEIERIVTQWRGTPAAVAEMAASSNGQTRVDEVMQTRWYPVIDYDRCGNCLECLNFCLFGVFGLDESGAVVVEQPDACRDGCPACARVCPAGAIMFPQHNSPAIAGDPKATDTAAPIDVAQLLGGTNNLSAAELAAAERLRALSQQPKGEQPKSSPMVSDKTVSSDSPSARDALDDLIDRFDESHP